MPGMRLLHRTNAVLIHTWCLADGCYRLLPRAVRVPRRGFPHVVTTRQRTCLMERVILVLCLARIVHVEAEGLKVHEAQVAAALIMKRDVACLA